MKTQLTNAKLRPVRAGFTLIEVLIAITILAACFVMVVGSFANVLKAKEETELVLESMHHGDFAAEQVVAALKSSAFFTHSPEMFGFWHDDDDDRDSISWVTYSTAFMPEFRDTEEKLKHLKYGLHRIMLSIEEDDDGRTGLAVRAAPHLFDDEESEIDELEPWFVSYKVQGLNIRCYDEFSNEWADEWEYDRAIPHFVEVNLLIEVPDRTKDAGVWNRKETEEYFTMTRLVEMPVGITAKNASRIWQEDQEEQEGIDAQQEQDQAAAQQGGGANGTTGGASGINPYQQFGGNGANRGLGNQGGNSAGNRALQQRFGGGQGGGAGNASGRNSSTRNNSTRTSNTSTGSRTSLGGGARTSLGASRTSLGTSSGSGTSTRRAFGSGTR